MRGNTQNAPEGAFYDNFNVIMLICSLGAASRRRAAKRFRESISKKFLVVLRSVRVFFQGPSDAGASGAAKRAFSGPPGPLRGPSEALRGPGAAPRPLAKSR